MYLASAGYRAAQITIHVGPQIPEKLPAVPDFPDLVQIEIGHHDLILVLATLDEYTYRYGKIHATDRLVYWLRKPPANIPVGYLTQPTPAMPDEYKVQGDSLQSYRNYYIGAKKTMAKWKNRPIPEWWRDTV